MPEQKSNHTYTNTASGSSVIYPIYPKEELISEDYIKNVLTSDMVSANSAAFKIPVANAEGKISPSWLAEEINTTTLPLASDTIAIDKDNNEAVMTPHSTYISIIHHIPAATTDSQGIVQLTSQLDEATLRREDLAITPKALKDYLNDGFSVANYNLYGITKYASDTTVNSVLTASKIKTRLDLKDTSDYNQLAINPYTLYNYVSNNDLTLNTDSNIIFRKRTDNNTSVTTEDIGNISVNRTNKNLTLTVNSKTITLDSSGNTTFPGTIIASSIKTSSNDAPILGTKTIGSNSKPVYIKNGTITALTDNVGSTTKPIYMESGTLKPIEAVAVANGGTGATDRLKAVQNLTNEDVGTAANYFVTFTTSWGKFGYTSVANAKTVLGLGSAAYTNSNAYAAASHTHSYLALSGGTMTGNINRSMSATYVSGTNNAMINMTNTGNFGTWTSGYTKNYKVAQGTYPGSNDLVYLYSVTKANASSDTNTTTKSLTWNAATGVLTADSFSGPATTISSTLPISKGGTGATTRLAAAKNLTNEDVGTAANYFVTFTTSWGKFGYSTVANVKTALGLGSAAYTDTPLIETRKTSTIGTIQTVTKIVQVIE